MLQLNFFLFRLKIGLCSLISFFHYGIGFFAISLENFRLFLDLGQFFINLSPLRNWILVLGPVWNSQVIFFVGDFLNYLRLVFNKSILTTKTGISHCRGIVFKFSDSLRVLQVCRSFKFKISRCFLNWVTSLRKCFGSFFSLGNGSWFSGRVSSCNRLIFLLVFFLLVTDIELVWWDGHDFVLILLGLLRSLLDSHFSIVKGSCSWANLEFARCLIFFLLLLLLVSYCLRLASDLLSKFRLLSDIDLIALFVVRLLVTRGLREGLTRLVHLSDR